MDSYTETKKIEKQQEELKKELELKKKLKREQDEIDELNTLLKNWEKFLNKNLSCIVWQDELLKQIKPKLFTSLLEMNYKLKETPTTFFFWWNSRMWKTYTWEKIWEIVSKGALTISMSNYTSDAHLSSLTLGLIYGQNNIRTIYRKLWKQMNLQICFDIWRNWESS